MSPIRIVLIEDHELTRRSMELALKRFSHLEIVGAAATGREGLGLVKTLQPDIAIVDIGLPDIDGIEVTRQIKEQVLSPTISNATNSIAANSLGASGAGVASDAVVTSEALTTKVVILTLRDNESVVLAAFTAGADSYCMKDVSSEQLQDVIQTTHDGYNWIDPAIAGIVLRQTRQNSPLLTSGVAVNPMGGQEMVSIHASEVEYHEILEISPLTERELEVLELIVAGQSNLAIAEKLFITVGTVKTHVRNVLNKLCADDRTQAAVRALRAGLIR